MEEINKNSLKIIIREKKESWRRTSQETRINEIIWIKIKIIKKRKEEKIDIIENENNLIKSKK